LSTRRIGPAILIGSAIFVTLFALACSSSSSSSNTPTAVRPTSAAATAPATTAAAAPTTAAAAPTVAAAPTTAAAAATVKIGDSSLGKVLTDSRGLTLYTFNRDVAGGGASAVSGGLLAAWPALKLASGNPVKPDGLTGDLGLITRDDGSKQVTYKGLPLYFWQNDKNPGDVTGQNIAGFVIAAP
jgi:predicted lipoprotein with Yx(FWY)xxD motif